MNKTARNTALGKLIFNQKIANERELNQYVLNNLSNNLFDYRDYQETIEYFRETIRAFDYNRILNSFINETTRESIVFKSDEDDETEPEENQQEIFSIPNASSPHNQRRSLSLDADTVFEKYDSNSNDEMDIRETNYLNIKPNTDTTQNSNNKLNKNKIGYSKSHLRIIYEWLRGLYTTQTREGTNVLLQQRSNSCYSKMSAYQPRLPSSSIQSQMNSVPSR